MATIGKTATPNTGTHGWISQTGRLVMMAFTNPGGWYSSVTFWAAGNGATRTLHGGIWKASDGSNLAFGPGVATSGGTGSGTGGNAWWTDTFSSEVFIPASIGTIWLGWQPDTSSLIAWGYNGNDHSPNAFSLVASGGSPANILSGAQESPAGAVAAYASYTQYAPSTPTFSPSTGGPGTTVTISGNHFLPVTSVTFNGVSASFSVVNDTTITATVPSGAGAGPIVVTSPYGSGTSATNFLAGILYRRSGGLWVAKEVNRRSGASWVFGLPQRRGGTNWNVSN